MEKEIVVHAEHLSGKEIVRVNWESLYVRDCHLSPARI